VQPKKKHLELQEEQSAKTPQQDGPVRRIPEKSVAGLERVHVGLRPDSKGYKKE
jgi:hypothetical protein